MKHEQIQLENEQKIWEYLGKDIAQEHKWVSKHQNKFAKNVDWNSMENKHKQFRMKYNDLLKKHAELVKEYKTIIANYNENSVPSNLLDRQQRLQVDLKTIKAEHKQMIDTHKHMHHMHETMMNKMQNMHNMKNMNMNINVKMNSMKSCEGNMNCKSCEVGNANCKSCEANINCKSK